MTGSEPQAARRGRHRRRQTRAGGPSPAGGPGPVGVTVTRAVSDSDCLSNDISPRARWVVCPLCSTRSPGTAAGGLYAPGGFENTEKKNQCHGTSNGRVPAASAWPQGQQREEQGDNDLFIFSLALLAIFW